MPYARFALKIQEILGGSVSESDDREKEGEEKLKMFDSSSTDSYAFFCNTNIKIYEAYNYTVLANFLKAFIPDMYIHQTNVFEFFRIAFVYLFPTLERYKLSIIHARKKIYLFTLEVLHFCD